MSLPPSESIAVSVDALRSNPLRTFLSTLGVVIGVAALVAILALGDGLERYGRQQIEQTTDLQVITITPSVTERVDGVLVMRPDPASIEPADIAALRRRLGDLAGASLILQGSTRLDRPGAEPAAILITATLPNARDILPWPVAAGRFLQPADVEGDEPVAVVSSSLARLLAPETGAVGAVLDVAGRRWQVVGALDDDDDGRTMYVPLTSWALEQWGRDGRRPPTAVVRAHTLEAVPDVRAAVDGWVQERYGDTDRVVVSSNRERASQARQAMLVFKLAMAAIAAISLLVGGIGIMNILLASISERTREIGIRKAAGARPRDILVQFLAESVAIAGLGSLVGVLLGMGGAFLVAAGIRWTTDAPLQAAFTWPSVVSAAAAALVVGLVFGTYPARRAARLSPIEALRYE